VNRVETATVPVAPPAGVPHPNGHHHQARERRGLIRQGSRTRGHRKHTVCSTLLGSHRSTRIHDSSSAPAIALGEGLTYTRTRPQSLCW
jgi:hypothetical protein